MKKSTATEKNTTTRHRPAAKFSRMSAKEWQRELEQAAAEIIGNLKSNREREVMVRYMRAVEKESKIARSAGAR